MTSTTAKAVLAQIKRALGCPASDNAIGIRPRRTLVVVVQPNVWEVDAATGVRRLAGRLAPSNFPLTFHGVCEALYFVQQALQVLRTAPTLTWTANVDDAQVEVSVHVFRVFRFSVASSR